MLVVSGKDKDGKDTLSRYRMYSVWVKQKGNWRLANIHATPYAREKARATFLLFGFIGYLLQPPAYKNFTVAAETASEH